MFEKLFEAAPDAIVVVDSNGIVTHANPQTEKYFGYARGELIGRPIELLVPERYHEHHAADRNSFQSSPHTRPMGAGLELWGKRKDGSEFPVDIMLSPLDPSDGSQVIAVIRDVTDRKQAEDALRLSEERFRLLVEGVKDYAIFMLDTEGRVESWNPAAERIMGHTAGEIVGQHFSVFYTAEDIKRGRPAEALRLVATQDRYEGEGWRLRKDGSRFWAENILTVLRDQVGKPRGFVAVVQDITEKKKAQESLLLEITNVLVTNLDVSRLLSAVAASVRQVTPSDSSALSIYDSRNKCLRLQFLTVPEGIDPAKLEAQIPLEGSPAGYVFTSREPLVLNLDESDRFTAESLERWRNLGMKSVCWLPLISHGAVLGTLTIASRREAAFTEREVGLMRQVAIQVAIAIENAFAHQELIEQKEKLVEEKLYLEDELRTEFNFEEIVGESAQLRRILKQVETVAPTDATVMILGETGTGKELIARAIHNLSSRSERTFVKVSCAAIPAGLLESELFGHERGAFTGAISQKLGRLELAHRGTLFLDEVGDIPLELQPKLLRALQEREFERLGSTRTIPVDVRLVAATNRDLQQMVNSREFRMDLFYRINVFPINVPPLRERAEDIPILVRYFVQKHAQRMRKQIDEIPPEAMEALVNWHWPGNVRELENFIERAVILSPGRRLRVIASELRPLDEPPPSSIATLEDTERAHILRVLQETKGVISGPRGAASRLGLKRTTLNSKMQKLGISRHDY